MIPSRAEITNALKGALRLARFDASGFNFFNRTPEGFWNSFFAALLVGPLQLLLSYAVADASGGVARVGSNWLLGLLAFIVHWLAFPVVMISVADWLDRRHRYFVYIVAVNWCNLPQVLLLLFIYSPMLSMILPPDTARFLGAAAVAYILIYEWYVAKVGLDISGGKAFGIVLLDSFVGFAVFSAASIAQH